MAKPLSEGLEVPQNGPKKKSWAYVPTLYFCEGLPYEIVNNLSTIIYKNQGVSNALIGQYTSLLSLPWTIKPLWSPLVDLFLTKRKWILITEILLAVLIGGVALTLQMPQFFALSLLLFFMTAFVSATHDIAVDGYYMLTLSSRGQAFYTGIRSTFYKVAKIAASGGMVVWAGHLIKTGTGITQSWMIVLGAAAAAYFLLGLFHLFYLPHPEGNTRGERRAEPLKWTDFLEPFRTYFAHEKIIPILAFILLYRLGEGMLTRMINPFLLDPVAQGGLGLDTEMVGMVYGTIGISGLFVGGILGGMVISRFGLRRCLWPMAFAIHLPNLAFVYMSTHVPNVTLVSLLVATEQLGYGFGYTAFTVFLMSITGERFKTAHFAISTGLMALGMMVPGILSGYLQQALGYHMFFIVVCLATVPSFFTLFFIPLPDEKN
ncbi:MAG: MFS transporter [Verrucomicrobiae bacterium]|nr:MFS transporter [Verrucomicrobiae bacterium]